ncbi:uncharacterized protein FYW61_019322 [Anableps anableps]
MGAVYAFSLASLYLAVSFSPSAEGLKMNATPGQDVTLSCKAWDYRPLKIVEWSRSGKTSEYILIVRNQNSDPIIPEQSYKGRVELLDTKEGDVSLILKNVGVEDSGTYKCYAVKKANQRKRAIMLPQPIRTIYLDVAPPPPPPPGHGHLGLIAGLVVFALVFALAAVLMWKKKTLSPPHDEAVHSLQV